MIQKKYHCNNQHLVVFERNGKIVGYGANNNIYGICAYIDSSITTIAKIHTDEKEFKFDFIYDPPIINDVFRFDLLIDKLLKLKAFV